jgi:hypothetical protein
MLIGPNVAEERAPLLKSSKREWFLAIKGMISSSLLGIFGAHILSINPLPILRTGPTMGCRRHGKAPRVFGGMLFKLPCRIMAGDTVAPCA